MIDICEHFIPEILHFIPEIMYFLEDDANLSYTGFQMNLIFLNLTYSTVIEEKKNALKTG